MPQIYPRYERFLSNLSALPPVSCASQAPDVRPEYLSNLNIQLAPMMEYTDVHYRKLISLISPRIELWTEMVTSMALCNTSHDPFYMTRFLRTSEPPTIPNPNTVLQLGGSEPEMLKQACEIVSTNMPELGKYKEINLNCGCPSDKVSLKGCFGARLMTAPELVAQCVKEMREVMEPLGVEVSVKCRIGVDDEDGYEQFENFVQTVITEGGCKKFQIHARKAVLDGTFSPVDNRNIPPLKYDYVYRLTRAFPDVSVTLNGGVNSISDVIKVAKECYDQGGVLDGVMIGRAIVAQPWYWSCVDEVFYGEKRVDGVETRRDLIREYGVWADGEEVREGSKKARRRILRPVVNIFNGEKGGKRWRNKIDDIMKTAGSKRKGYKDESGDDRLLSELLMDALEVMEGSIVDQTRSETMELMLLKEEIIDSGKDCGGGADGVAMEAIKIWKAERRERESKIKEEEGDIEELALRGGAGGGG